MDGHWERDEYSQDYPEYEDPRKQLTQRSAHPPNGASEPAPVKERKEWNGRGSKGDRKAQAKRYYAKNRSKRLEYARAHYQAKRQNADGGL
jgi:hypothetical protein